MGDITANFSYSEFVVSDSYPELAAKIELTAFDRYKAFVMAKLFLQPLRDLLDLVAVVKSGKRSVLLNKKVGGVVSSDHLWNKFSIAADVKFRKKGAPKDSWEPIGNYWGLIHRYCFRMRQFVNQLIWYYPNTGNFIHLSMADGGKLWDVKYCVSRDGRQYFSSPVEADNYLRGIDE